MRKGLQAVTREEVFVHRRFVGLGQHLPLSRPRPQGSTFAPRPRLHVAGQASERAGTQDRGPLGDGA